MSMRPFLGLLFVTRNRLMSGKESAKVDVEWRT
jgi:hypothetical protein